MNERVDVEQLVDEQKLGWFNLNLLVWSFLAMFADGYEITAMAFAGPELVRDWGIEPGSLGPVFSASLVGIFVGAPLLGYVGDRYGRKTAILIGLVICGISTLAMVAATSMQLMFVLRLFAGIGIGGLMPNTVSLTSEYSPKRFRATLIVLMFTGITVGAGTPSIVAVWLVPGFGWTVLFWVGGIVPLLVASCVVLTLPESIKFLALHPGRRSALLRNARKLRPDLRLPESADFQVRATTSSRGSGLSLIFGGGLQWITPLLWFCFATTLMANFFLNSWMPILFEHSGLSPGDAALASGLYHVGGTTGGIAISLLLDRFGFVVITVFLALAVPVVASLGFDTLPHAGLLLLSLASGVCVLGAQFGNNAAGGILYPTAFRAKGLGWAFSAGRLGSILGPLIGGILIAQHWSAAQLFAVASIPLAAGSIAAAILVRICFRRFNGLQLDDSAYSIRKEQGKNR